MVQLPSGTSTLTEKKFNKKFVSERHNEKKSTFKVADESLLNHPKKMSI